MEVILLPAVIVGVWLVLSHIRRQQFLKDYVELQNKALEKGVTLPGDLKELVTVKTDWAAVDPARRDHLPGPGDHGSDHRDVHPTAPTRDFQGCRRRRHFRLFLGLRASPRGLRSGEFDLLVSDRQAAGRQRR